ncbi:MAG: WXG100 family type VII secretion target [Planctomycetota bacterium]|nr:WXG100 family type VII secretion target [Planctomycetota bacterium]MDA1177580.1 WXG100 family type VII secretion target [Planctomycetota bacterium]
MAQAVVDPEELRQFAASLRRMQTGMRDQLGGVKHQLDALAATWRDQEHARFSERFVEHTRAIAKLTEESDEYIHYLLRKAEQIEAYLQS